MVRDTLIIACFICTSIASGRAANPAQQAAPRPAQAASDDAALAARLDEIDRRAGQAVDLVGRFRQEKFTALLKKPLVSSGRIRMKGSVVRWDTESPEPGVLYSDGREIRMYYPKQATVEVYPIDKRVSDLASSPLPRLAVLREHFKIGPLPAAKVAESDRDPAKYINLLLTPSDTFLAEHVDEVRVTLDVSTACVAKVEVFDSDGDRTVIRFLDVKTNAGVKPGELDLVVPAGTKVSHPLEAVQGGAKK